MEGAALVEEEQRSARLRSRGSPSQRVRVANASGGPCESADRARRGGDAILDAEGQRVQLGEQLRILGGPAATASASTSRTPRRAPPEGLDGEVAKARGISSRPSPHVSEGSGQGRSPARFRSQPTRVQAFYVDLHAPLLLRNLGRVARRLQELSPEQAHLDVQEMLPGPDELWLTDPSGRRYTSEFRLVAVDQRPRPQLDIPAEPVIP